MNINERKHTWIKYAEDGEGTNMSDNSDGKSYIGFAYDKNDNLMSDNPKDYVWFAFEGGEGYE